MLEVQPISESSRIQRRGRVGRIAKGTVYYMYEKKARVSIKPIYKITNEDISELLLTLLTNENELITMDRYDKLIISDICNPNIYNNIKNLENDQINDIYVKKSLINILKTNYKINNDYLDEKYCIYPMCAYQRRSYSDIQEIELNYGHFHKKFIY